MVSQQPVSLTVPEALSHAIDFHRAGNLVAAEKLYRTILQVEPNHADSIHLLGVIANQVGNQSAAIQLISAAIQLNPNSSIYYNNLGEAYRALERFGDAKQCYLHSLKLQPGYSDACNNLGIVLQHEGNLEAAEQFYRQCLSTQPEQVEAISNLGTVLQANGLLNEAEEQFLRALQLNPHHAATHNNLGRIYTDRGDYLAAERSIRRAVELQPDLWMAYENLAIMLRAQGKTDEARAAFEVSLAKAPHDGLKIQYAFLTPIIMNSRAQIAEVRQQVTDAIARLKTESLSVTDPVEKIGVNLFYLPYHGLNDRALQRGAAEVYERAAPSLRFVAPHCRSGAVRAPRERLRVGFISKYFFEHSVGRHNAGIIANLDRTRFHVTVFYFPGTEDAMTHRICASADQSIKLSARLDLARQAIANQELDALVYTDIGMDPWTFFLAFSRLAPVQCVLPGHPVTTGIDTVDYFISSRDMEPPGAQDHYTEKLVLFENLPTYFGRPPRSTERYSREHFHLAADDHLYVVGQMLFKVHPDFDAVLQQILQADPQGRVVLFEGYQKHWTAALRARLERTVADVIDRITILPWLKVEEFISLLGCADLFLDTFPFSGGTTSLQALSVGLPIITLPSEFLRGRQTLGMYRAIDFKELIASDIADYVRKAVWLGTDRAANQRVRQQLAERAPRLFENHGIVDELGRFLIHAVQECAGKP